MARIDTHQKELDITGGTRRRPVSFKLGPNPGLQEFVKAHRTPYDPKTDRYDVPAFTKDLLVNKAAEPKAIYDMHSYWSKKHWAAIREYIRHYLPEKFYRNGTGLIADPFCGSGMTGVAALMEGRPCVLIDASPAAAFIAHHYTHPVDPELLKEGYQKMLTEEYDADLKAKLRKIVGRSIQNLRQELDWLYETKCDRCGGKASIDYMVYSQTFQCPNCGEIVPLFDCPTADVEDTVIVGRGKTRTEWKKRTVCPHCYAKHHKRARPEFVISTRRKCFGEKPVMVAYACENGCMPKRDFRKWSSAGAKKLTFESIDLPQIETLGRHRVPHDIPDRFMMDISDPKRPWGMEWRPGRNFRKIKELYTHRNFWALAAIQEAAKQHAEIAGYLASATTAISLNASRMYRYRPSGKGGITMGTYYIPQVSQNMSAPKQLADKIPDLIKGHEALVAGIRFGAVVITQEKNSVLASVPANSVDLIFTDPPYAEKTQYGELNFVWEAWLEFDGAWRKYETVVKDSRVDPEGNYTLDKWEERLREAFRGSYHALKPGHWMCLCYHDTAEGTWRRVQDALVDIGFEIHSVTVLDPLQKSANQITAEKVVKSDLVLNCRKPKEAQAELPLTDEVPRSIRERVRAILEDTLAENPGLTRDKLFDIVTRRLLERAQMAKFKFEEILSEVATLAEGDRWYLKAELEKVSQDEQANEEAAGAALERFARLRCTGVPAKYAALIALDHARLVPTSDDLKENDETLEDWINEHLLKEDRDLLLKKGGKRLELGGNLAGIEFYDALFFYLTKYLKGRRASQLPRRNLAEFLQEYLIRFREGEKWLYRMPKGREAEELRKGRQSGLGRRIRAFTRALQAKDEAFLAKHRPDVRTFVEWLRYCASYGHYEEGVALYDLAGLTIEHLKSVLIDEEEEETAYDAARTFSDICRKKLAQSKPTVGDEDEAESDEE